MAIIIHLKVVKGLLIRSRIASSLVSERDRVLHRLACSWRLSQSKGSLSLSLPMCVCCVEPSMHGRCQRNPPAAAGDTASWAMDVRAILAMHVHTAAFGTSR